MKQLLNIFPIPIKIISLESVFQHSIDRLIHQIDQEKFNPNQLIKKGYQSLSNSFLDKNLWFKQIFQDEVDVFVNEYGIKAAKISYSWCNIYIKGGEIRPHKHEMSVISGVYYPLIKGDNVFLKIRNPCNPFKINEITEKTNEFNLQEYAIPIQENMLILFPSWIEHYSENTNEIKYAVSFDTEIIRCLG
jgi:uncharacterized protein (TIGR02466 family)